MSNDNYPAGVTDAHPHFNPQEISMMVECGADEALVLPSFAVKQKLNDLLHYVENLVKLGHTPGGEILASIAARIEQAREELEPLEQEREYECPYRDERLLDVSEEAHWDCPDCGNERVSDTIPEDRDPDEGWDNRHDD